MFQPNAVHLPPDTHEPFTYLLKKASVRCMARLKLPLMLWLSPG